MYLYVKTHNVTGLKYLGKTVKDPFNYKGSGTYWRRHLIKHGNDVTTEILLETDDTNALKQAGIYFSKQWDIVNSDAWANIVEEQGDGGDTSKSYKHIQAMKNKDVNGLKNPFYGKKHTKETKSKISQANKGRLLGRKQTEEHVRKRIPWMEDGSLNPMYGKDPWNKGKSLPPQSDETRRKKGRPLVFYGVEYNSINEAEVKTGISAYKIKKNCTFL
jgi:hypothetical protein